MVRDNKIWHLNHIPRILHIYWGGGKLNYLRFLTVKTFLALNPDWQVIYWTPKEPFTGRSWGPEKGCEEIKDKHYKDYTSELEKITTKTIIDFKEYHYPDTMPEVHKNDYIRIYALFYYGGVWSDMDIIYFKPIDKLKVNTPENKNKESFVCIGSYGHSTGFNMATEKSEFFRKLDNEVLKQYQPRNYQIWGPDLFNKHFKTIHSIPGGVNISMDAVYAHDCYHMPELLQDVPVRFNDESIGCHWYGGNSLWGKFLNRTNGGEVNLTNNIISKLIKDANRLKII